MPMFYYFQITMASFKKSLPKEKILQGIFGLDHTCWKSLQRIPKMPTNLSMFVFSSDYANFISYIIFMSRFQQFYKTLFSMLFSLCDKNIVQQCSYLSFCKIKLFLFVHLIKRSIIFYILKGGAWFVSAINTDDAMSFNHWQSILRFPSLSD